MAKTTAARKTPATDDCTREKHGQIATSTGFKMCPHCGVGLAQFRPQTPTPDPAPVRKVNLDITPAPEAGQALQLRDQALALRVTDKASHAIGREMVRGGKQLLRAIDEHWSKITRQVDEMKRNLLKLKADDREPVAEAVSIAERAVLDYEDEERRRVDAENDRLRREDEERARRKREDEARQAEEDAQRAERDSPVLSKREEVFADYMAIGDPDPVVGARAAGFKNPKEDAASLLRRQKIQDAIQAKRTARAIREQSAARRDQPLEYRTRTVAPQTATVAGTRRTAYYSAAIDRPEQLVAAVIAGHTTSEAVIPSQTYLNDQARQLKDAAAFAAAFPGCRLVKKDGLAG
jgi:hypothetical protein